MTEEQKKEFDELFFRDLGVTHREIIDIVNKFISQAKQEERERIIEKYWVFLDWRSLEELKNLKSN